MSAQSNATGAKSAEALSGGEGCGAYGLNFEPQENSASTGTFTLQAQADAELDFATPNTNVGSATTMTVDGGTDPAKAVLMRFEVRDFVNVTSAVLRFNVTNGSVDGPILVLGSDAWAEANVTYGNYTLGGRLIYDYNAIGTGIQNLNVTSLIDRNGVFTFEFRGQNADGTIITSKDNATANLRPVLVVTGTKNPTLNPLTACAPYWPQPHQDGTMFLSQEPGNHNSTSGLAAAHGPGMIGVTFHNGDHNGGYDSRKRNFEAIDNAGNLLATYTLGNIALPSDPEEIQVGPGPAPETSYVYLGDIGDNNHSRANIAIHRVSEPTSLANVTYNDAESLTLTYAGSIKINAEAFLVDPVTGSLYVIEKACIPADGNDKGAGTLLGKARIFTVPAPLPFGGSAVLQNTGYSLDFASDSGSCNCAGPSCAGGNFPTTRVTAAAASLNGSILAVAGYTKVYSWFRPANKDLAWTLAQTSTAGGFRCPQSQASEMQREAITFGNCNDVSPHPTVRTSGEGVGAGIFAY